MSVVEYVVLGSFVVFLVVCWRVMTRQVRYYEGLVKANVQVLTNNKRVCRHAELSLFSWKEHGLWMHDVTQDTLTVMSYLRPVDANAVETLDRVTAALIEQLQVIDGDFERTFQLSPEEYRKNRNAKVLCVSDVTGKPVDYGNTLSPN